MEVIAKVVRQEKEIKGIKVGKEEVKLIVSYLQMIRSYTEKPLKTLLKNLNSVKLQDTKIKINT